MVIKQCLDNGAVMLDAFLIDGAVAATFRDDPRPGKRHSVAVHSYKQRLAVRRVEYRLAKARECQSKVRVGLYTIRLHERNILLPSSIAVGRDISTFAVFGFVAFP